MGYYCGGRQCCWDRWTRLILPYNLCDIRYGKGDGSLIDIWFGNWGFDDDILKSPSISEDAF